MNQHCTDLALNPHPSARPKIACQNAKGNARKHRAFPSVSLDSGPLLVIVRSPDAKRRSTMSERTRQVKSLTSIDSSLHKTDPEKSNKK